MQEQTTHHSWRNTTPVTKHGAIARAFQAAFGTCNVDEITPLTGGRSSALVYKVIVDKRPYVLRVVLQTDALTDPVRHFTALNAAANAGIAPPVRYTNADDAISIVDFIEHTPLNTTLTSDQELFTALGGSIKAIHSLPLFPKLVGFLDGVESLISRFHTLDVLPSSATVEHFRHYETVQRIYPRHDTNLVSSHNDFNPTNVLHSGGKLWVIDWEVAFANDSYVDLACANIFFGSGERGEDILLKTYFGEELTDYHRARFFLMQQVCFTYVAMLFMHLTSVLRTPEVQLSDQMETPRLPEFFARLRNGEVTLTSADEHLFFAKVLLGESLAPMKTDRFKEAVTLIEEKNLL